MKKILVPHGVKKRIAKEVNTTYVSVRLALNCERTTFLSRKIREKALELGGITV